MSKHRLERLKTAGFILKPETPSIKGVYQDIKQKFRDRDIEVLLADKSADMISDNSGINFEQMCQKSDILVSLGGDGTLLSLVRRSYKWHKPILGINAGNLGFLADIVIDEVDSFLDKLLRGEYRIDERMMMEGYIQRGDKKESFYAFNDVVITRPTISKMVNIEAYIDDELFNIYRGDGLILSTPTGSTAYNLAAGGPVVYPLTDAFIMTPICAHSLTQRPLLMPADFEIGISSPKDTVVAMIDGQDSYEMHRGDILRLRGAKVGAKLLHRVERNYFEVLRDKLQWGEEV